MGDGLAARPFPSDSSGRQQRPVELKVLADGPPTAEKRHRSGRALYGRRHCDPGGIGKAMGGISGSRVRRAMASRR